MVNVTAWFVRMTALPSFRRSFGAIKLAQKLMKPAIKLAVKEKPKAAEKKVAPKPKADEDAPAAEKKEINPLDALPPSSFDLFNFKTFFVNHKDKKGEAIDEMLKIFDAEGYSFYKLDYEMFGSEGQVLFKTVNLCKGFLQRFDSFRKHAFARHIVMGEEPKLKIEGVWLWRGSGIPQEAIDHPQFEYYKNRKMDIKDPEDVRLIREFWGAEEGGMVDGNFAQTVCWHK